MLVDAALSARSRPATRRAPMVADAAATTLLRVDDGLTLATHGWPKLLGRPHGSVADPMAGSVRPIDTVLGLPLAPQLDVLVALLEGVGGLLLAAGAATPPVALASAVQMIAICFTPGSTYRWIDRESECAIMLALVAITLVAGGGGVLSLDQVRLTTACPA